MIWRVDPRKPRMDLVLKAAAVIREGGVIVYPTETFYGLGGDPLSESAVERIYRLKGRDFGKPLPLIASDRSSVLRAAAEWPPRAQRLADAFWPGPLTMVVPASSLFPSRLHGLTNKVAVRISPHPVALALASAAGGLLISTSANLAGRPPFCDADKIPASFLALVDGVLHAGCLAGGQASTIVDVSTEPPLLVRAGCIPWESIGVV